MAYNIEIRLGVVVCLEGDLNAVFDDSSDLFI